MNRKGALPGLRCLQDFLSVLDDGTVEMQFWLRHGLIGVPIFNLGPFEKTKSDLANLDRRWEELFLLPAPISGVLYVWPDFAFLHIQKDERDVTARLVLLEERRFWLCPVQAHFHRAEKSVSYSPWALVGNTDSSFGADDETKAWLPDMYLRALDANRAQIASLKPGESWDAFAGIVPLIGVLAA